ncbi:MAG: hypothetical protein AB1631_07960 [Acidobacteriota bacterium]
MSENRKPTIGVMGAASDALGVRTLARLASMAEKLGAAIAARGCVLMTGATTGLTDMVARAARTRGALTIGISPAANEREHVEKYNLPLTAEVIVYTGFGLKGRNVVNIRSSDVVIIFGGGMGTLNEFTIAYDEGKIIGVLHGSGGVADHIAEIIDFARKPTRAKVIYNEDPDQLIDHCLRALGAQ